MEILFYICYSNLVFKTNKDKKLLHMKKVIKFSKIKKGQLFKFPGKKKVYVFDGGGKVRGFNYYEWDNINNSQTTKTDRIIDIDFEF